MGEPSIPADELYIDELRAGSESHCRIVHLPTGVWAEGDSREAAMSALLARRAVGAESVDLPARLSALADLLDAEAVAYRQSGYLHECGEASGRSVAAYRIRRILSGGSDDDDA